MDDDDDDDDNDDDDDDDDDGCGGFEDNSDSLNITERQCWREDEFPPASTISHCWESNPKS